MMKIRKDTKGIISIDRVRESERQRKSERSENYEHVIRKAFIHVVA